MKTYLFKILVVIPFLFLDSCHITDDVDLSCKVISMVAQDGTSTFGYLNNDLITSAVLPSENLEMKFYYDADNRVVKAEYYDLTKGAMFEYTEYSWVDLFNINAITYANADGTFQPVSKSTTVINDNNDPVKRSYYLKDQNGQWYYDRYREIIWDMGNIVRIEYFKKKDGEDSFYNKNTKLFEYDHKQNPWRNVSVREVNENEDIFISSANNPVKITFIRNLNGEKEVSDYTYRYNADNLPISYVKTTKLPDGSTTTFKVSEIKYNCQ